jgi:transcriptional regulator with GAF, ATPase, and Fis domain
VKLLRVLRITSSNAGQLAADQGQRAGDRGQHKDLEQAISDRTFREDLYYRLNVFPIRIPRCANASRTSRPWSGPSSTSSPRRSARTSSRCRRTACALLAYSWGNVRELRNVVERAMIIATGPNLVIELPRATSFNKRKSLKFADVEVEHIRSVLEATGWRIRGRGGAAELIGMKPTTLESRMAKLGIVRDAKHDKVPTGRHSG